MVCGKMVHCLSKKVLVFASITVLTVGFSGCIGTPFRIVGDALDTTADVAGDLVETTVDVAIETPVDVVTSVADASVPDFRKRYTEHHYWPIDREDISLIEVRTSDGDIIVRATGAEQIEVHAWKKVWARSASSAERYADDVDIRVERSGDRLQLISEHPSFHGKARVRVRYEIATPADMDLDLHTSDGDVSITGLRGVTTVRTSDGDVDISRCEGEFELRTTDGDIEFGDYVGSVDGHTSDGRIRGTIQSLSTGDLTTSDGSVDLSIHEGIDFLKVKTSDGYIKIRIPKDYRGKLDARTSSGSIRTDLFLNDTTTYEKRLSGFVGEETGREIDLDTSDGDIRVESLR